MNQAERLLGKLKTSFLRTGLVIRNSSLPSFCNLLPKSSRSRNFNMDRLFDKKKIVNLQIAVEVTRSSRKFSLFNLTYKTVSRRITARSRKVKSISLFSIKNPIESQRSRCTTPRIKSALHVRKTFFRGSLGARSAGLFCLISLFLFLSPSRETRSIQFNRVTRLT